MASPFRIHYFYQVLKVRPTSTPEEIKASFFKLSRLYHPDNLNTGDKQKFIRIKQAFEQIKDAPLISDRRENIGYAYYTMTDAKLYK